MERELPDVVSTCEKDRLEAAKAIGWLRAGVDWTWSKRSKDSSAGGGLLSLLWPWCLSKGH